MTDRREGLSPVPLRRSDPPERARVLVIDDDAVIRLIVRTLLTSAAYEVEEGLDGEDGVARALASAPDAIVMDLMMPVVDGFEALKRLRTDARTVAVPVIVLSALTSEDTIRRCSDFGATEVLAKPFTPDALFEALSRVLTQKVTGGGL